MSSVKTLVFPTTDVDAAKAIISVLAGAPHTDQPFYVGWNVDGLEIGLNPGGHATGMTGPTNYWQAEDIEKTFADLVAAGATAAQPPTEFGGGTTIASVTDADGNPIGLIARS